MNPKPFGWITAKTAASVEKMSKSINPDFMTAMIRNSQYNEAKVPIFLGAAPPQITRPVIDAGNNLATIAFNLCQDKNLLPEHARILKEAYEAWDHARRTT